MKNRSRQCQPFFREYYNSCTLISLIFWPITHHTYVLTNSATALLHISSLSIPLLEDWLPIFQRIFQRLGPRLPPSLPPSLQPRSQPLWSLPPRSPLISLPLNPHPQRQPWSHLPRSPLMLQQKFPLPSLQPRSLRRSLQRSPRPSNPYQTILGPRETKSSVFKEESSFFNPIFRKYTFTNVLLLIIDVVIDDILLPFTFKLISLLNSW